MKPEPRLLRRKRVWPLLLLLLLLIFWFSRQTATISPASRVTADGPSEARLAAIAAEDLSGGDLSPFRGPDENLSWAVTSTSNPSAVASTNVIAAVPGMPSSAPTGRSLSPGTESPIMAQVDMAQLLAAHPPVDDTPEARQVTLLRIREAISQQAVARGFLVVLDCSLQNEWGMPMVLSARGLFDLTAAVELALAR